MSLMDETIVYDLSSNDDSYMIDDPIVYDLSANYDSYTTIMMVDTTITSYELFVSSVNSHTFPLIVNTRHQPEALSEFLTTKFPNVKRIGIASHGPLDVSKEFQTPYFIGDDPFFQDSDLNLDTSTYSTNVVFMRQLIVSMGLSRIDFLGCNLLQIPKFKTYFDILKKDNPTLTIGASNDQTGNILYGGDWTMENTNDNIKYEYFTDVIGIYSSLLASYTNTIAGYTYTFTYTEGNTYCTVSTITPLTGDLVMADSLQDANGNSYNITSFGQDIWLNNTLTSLDVCAHFNLAPYWTFINARSMPTISFARTSLTILPKMDSGTYVTVTLPSTCTELPTNCFANCSSLTTINGFSYLTNIGGQAFLSCTSFVPPSFSNITIYGLRAFKSCPGITTFVPGAGVTYMRGVFENCTNLATVDLSALNMDICVMVGSQFSGTIIQSITLPSNMTLLPNNMFSSCTELLTVDLSGITTFHTGGYQFHNCKKLHTISNFPQTITEIPPFCLTNCEMLTSFTIPPTVTSIGSLGMYGLGVTSLIIPPSVDTLHAACFSNNNELITCTIPRTVKYIKNGAETLDSSNYANKYWNVMQNCLKLEQLVVDYDIDVIGRNFAYGCTQLGVINIGSQITAIAHSSFQNAGRNMHLAGVSARPRSLTMNSNITLPSGNSKMYGYQGNQATGYYQSIKLFLRDEEENEYEYQGSFDGEGPYGTTLIDAVASFAMGNVNWLYNIPIPTPTVSESGVSSFTEFAGTVDLTDTAIVGTTTTEKREYTFNRMKKLVDNVSGSSGFALKNFFELDNVGQLPGLKRVYAKLKVFKSNSEVDASEITSGTAIYTPLNVGTYIIIPEGPASSVKWKITKTSETGYTKQLTTGGEITIHAKGDEFQLGSADIVLGSVELFYLGVNIQLSAFNTSLSTSKSAEGITGDWSISGDATITLNTTVPKLDMQNTFFYKLTEETISGSSIQYYVNSVAFTNASTVLNPKNGTIVTSGDGAYVAGDTIGEDYLRDTARQLFGTYLGADLFTNEDGIVEHINSECDGVASNIMTILENANITSTSLVNTDPELNNAKYINDSTSDTNICRELLNQLHYTAIGRFQDLETTVYNSTPGYYYVPFENGDVISYKVILEAPSDQHTVVATGASALTARTYIVKLNIVD